MKEDRETLTQQEIEPAIAKVRAALAKQRLKVDSRVACALVHLGIEQLLRMGLVRTSLIEMLRGAANAEMERCAKREGLEWRPLSEGEP